MKYVSPLGSMPRVVMKSKHACAGDYLVGLVPISIHKRATIRTLQRNMLNGVRCCADSMPAG